jgi:hypothetical protein
MEAGWLSILRVETLSLGGESDPTSWGGHLVGRDARPTAVIPSPGAGSRGRSGDSSGRRRGGEAGAALGAVLPVGGGLGLAGLALLDEAVQGVEVGAEALLEGLLGWLLGLARLGHVTYRAGPG